MIKTTLATATMALALALTSCGGSSTQATQSSDAQAATISNDSTAIDTAASTIQWKGTKPGGEHWGTVALQSGQIYTNEAGELVGGNFTIDMASIVCADLDEASGKQALETHLKNEDFFNVAKYPTAKFEITAVTPQATDSTTHLISGNLTLLDSTKNISFPATLTQANGVAEAKTVTFVIDRTQWGVTYSSKSIFAELKDKFINDNIELTITAKTIAK
ncbi:MAG: YceI family protein [Bacteroidales bacterium]|nr:YceI family protein [Bacteroidales bacterium]